MMSTIGFFKASAIAALAAISFAACGSGDDDAASADVPSATENDVQSAEVSNDAVVFDFTEQAVRAMPTSGVKEITFEVHPNLMELEPDYVDERLLESVTTRAKDHPDGQCGIEVTYQYVSGAQNAIDAMDSHVLDHETGDLVPEPEHVKYGKVLGTPRGQDRDYPGFNEDFSANHQAVECATDAYDSSETFTLKFTTPIQHDPEHPDFGQGPGHTLTHSTFTEAEINVMANGDLHVTDYSISGWQQDANGDWIQQ